MKKLFIIALTALGMLACSEQNKPSEPVDMSGVLPGKFFVSESKQVQFAQGNLQYQAKANKWRLAEKQYDIIGDGNSNISDMYDGWIDLFGWGTGSNPTNKSTNDSDYSEYVEWGTNAISNGGNKANLWRTLTNEEWIYLFSTRANAATLFGLGCVNDINGMIILPDNWQSVAGVSFSSGGDSYSMNIYTADEWSVMEQSGAVFLPAGGSRDSTEVNEVGSYGTYWSASLNVPFGAYYLYFPSIYKHSFGLSRQGGHPRNFGHSVRLVRKFEE